MKYIPQENSLAGYRRISHLSNKRDRAVLKNEQACDTLEIKAGVLHWIILINLVLSLFFQQLINFVLDL